MADPKVGGNSDTIHFNVLIENGTQGEEVYLLETQVFLNMTLTKGCHK